MNVLMEAFRAALTSLMSHRMRSFLTTLGILIGTASVIAVVSLVQGFSASIKDQFSDLGGSTMTLQAENSTENFRTGKINHEALVVDELTRDLPKIEVHRSGSSEGPVFDPANTAAATLFIALVTDLPSPPDGVPLIELGPAAPDAPHVLAVADLVERQVVMGRADRG